ncbi:hypothetical protein MCOR25_007759 [Pyricularia grisea]|nr:hypothetical protein MCOR25_007759 [Pyricularia grisea]
MSPSKVIKFPADNRIEPGSTDYPAAQFPTIKNTTVDVDAAADEIVDAFNKALDAGDANAVAGLFLPDGASHGYWRDHLCLTWVMRTLKGRGQIAGFLANEIAHDGGDVRLPKRITVDRSSGFRSPTLTAFEASGTHKCIGFHVEVEAQHGKGRGLARLAEGEDGKLYIATLFTSLVEIEGHPELVRGRRVKGVEHNGTHDEPNWRERREAAARFEDQEPTVLIVGAGQGGLSVAARLQMQGIPTLVIDRNPRVGDSWRTRYHHLVLHDPVWYDHMPYIPFPEHWPVFTPKDKIADFFESYVSLLELNVWTGTSLTDSSWDEEKREWTVKLERAGETRTVRPRHIIQATGHSGKKNFPQIKGMDAFKGARLCHSSEFPGATPNSAGKRAIVVGSCNSGHDIAQDFYRKGYDVTMVQRSSTCVVGSNAIVNIGLAGLYEEGGPPTEDADIVLYSYPFEQFKAAQRPVTALQNEADREILEALERVGFKVDMGPDACGLFIKYFQRGGGYYIDVGASQLVADGKIKIKQGCEISEVQADGLLFADGQKLEADEIVFATGYLNMRGEARAIFGDALADRVNDVWGFDDKGEHRTIWSRSGHPGFWFMGGNLALCRYFSRILALQIKAAELGLNKL